MARSRLRRKINSMAAYYENGYNGIAKATGISHPTFTHWKQGATPHFKSMVKIARFLGVSLDVFAEEALKC